MSKKVFVGADGRRAGLFAVFLDTENEKSCERETVYFPEF